MSKLKIRRGQGLVEFALILPILLLLFLGIAEGAHIIQSYLSAQNAVREAARYAVAGQPWLSEITGQTSGDGVPSWGRDERLGYILGVATDKSIGTGYRQIITDSAQFETYRADTCDQDTCSGIIAVRAGKLNTEWKEGDPPEDQWLWDDPGKESERLKVELYHNVAIFDPIYEAIVPNGFLRVQGAIVMRNEGGPPISGTATPPGDDNSPGAPPGGQPGTDPIIYTQSPSYPAGSNAVIIIERHTPNTTYAIYVDGQYIGDATADANGLAVIDFLIPPDWPPQGYSLESQLAGAPVALGTLFVTLSDVPIISIVGDSDVWPFGSLIEYSLLAHGVNTTYNIELYDPDPAKIDDLTPLTTDNNGNSSSPITASYQLPVLPTTWVEGDYTLKSMGVTTPTVLAERTITLLEGCIKIDQGACGVTVTVPSLVYANILIDKHAYNRTYIVKFDGTPLPSNVVTDNAGQAFRVYLIPDVPDGTYLVTTEDAANPGTVIATTAVQVDTPAGPYIVVEGGYTWPAGSKIRFHTRQHTPLTRYDIYWQEQSAGVDPIKIIDDPQSTTDSNGDGANWLEYTIPITVQGTFRLESRENVSDMNDPVVGESLDIDVTGLPYLEIAEGNPQIPGAEITVLVRLHAVNKQYDIYVGSGVADNEPGTILPGNPVTTDGSGNTEIKYTIDPSLAPGQQIRIRSYPKDNTDSPVAETLLDLQGADLIIASIEAPANPTLNAEVPLTITVVNNSPVTITHKSFDVDIYLDPVETPDLGRTLPPGDIKTWIQPVFPANGSVVLTTSLQIYGTEPHEIWARADTSNRINEGAFENNNLASILIQASGCEIEYTSTIFDPLNALLYGDAAYPPPGGPEPRLRLHSAGGSIATGNDGSSGSGNYLAHRTITATIPTSPPGGVVLNVDFNSDDEGFTYLDDTFGTNEPDYANGAWGAGNGEGDGGLWVEVGAINAQNNDIWDMSGGWQQSFDLNTASSVILTFRYRMDQNSEYENNEYSQVLASIDGVQIGPQVGFNGQPVIDELGGGGDTGWQTALVNLGTLSAGTHSIIIGGFNNQKTYWNERTDIYFDDVQVVQMTPILAATFDSDSQGFTYQDDTFRGTNEPDYADGSWGGAYGSPGGGVRVLVGAINGNNNDIDDMSGGWVQTFNLSAASEVFISFDYNFNRDNEYENNEYGQVLMSIDGTLVGQGGNDYIYECSRDNCGQPGWQNFNASLGTLAAGNHTIIIGGYNNRKTYWNEVITIDFDNVGLATPGSSTPPGPTSSFEVQARLLATDTNVVGTWGLEIREDTTDTAAKVALGYASGSNNITYWQRANSAAPTSGNLQTGVGHPAGTPTWIRIVKTGPSFNVFTAGDDGSGSHTAWSNQQSFNVADLQGQVEVGLFGTSGSSATDLFDFDNFRICEANSDCAAGTILYEAPGSYPVGVGSPNDLTGTSFGDAIASSPFHEIVSVTPPPPPASITINGDTVILNSKGSGAQNDTGEGYLLGYHQITGNFDVQVKLVSQTADGGSLNANAVAGLEVRADLTNNADKLDWGSMWLNSSNRRLQWLTRQSGSVNNAEYNTGNTLPVWLRIIRQDSAFALYYSNNTSDSPPENSWVEQTTKSMNLPNDVYLGLFNASADPDDISIATFSGYHLCGNQGGIASCGEVREANGLVVIDAGNEVANIQRTREWTTTARQGKAGFWVVDGGSPNIYNSGSYSAQAPELQYAVDFTNMGTYYVWALGSRPDWSGNSIHIGLTDSPPPSGNYASMGSPSNSLQWVEASPINVNSVGSTSISAWMREDGFELYQILLTTDANYNPNNESDPLSLKQSVCSSQGQPDIPPGMLQCTSLVVDGDFESNSPAWNFNTIGEQVTRTSLPHYFGPNQSWSIVFPATNLFGLPRQPWLYQDVIMPSWILTPTVGGGTSLLLNAHVAVNPEGAPEADPFYAALRDQTGQPHESSITGLVPLATGADTPAIDPNFPDPGNGEWALKTINLADNFSPPESILDYAGQPLRLFFESPNDTGNFSTRFYLDNVELKACTQQPAPQNVNTKISGAVWVFINGVPTPKPGVNVWAYAIDGTLDKTYTIHNSTFNFYNLPADPAGTQYIIYAEYYEDNTLYIASTIRVLYPGDQITNVTLLLN